MCSRIINIHLLCKARILETNYRIEHKNYSDRLSNSRLHM